MFDAKVLIKRLQSFSVPKITVIRHVKPILKLQLTWQTRTEKTLVPLSDQGTFTPVGAQGGFHGTPPEKTTFPPEFCNEICTIYVRDIKNHNSEKKKLNVVPFQNGGQITDFCFASF